METKEVLKKEVEKRFNELQAYVTLFNKKATDDRTQFIENNKQSFLKDSASVDLATIGRDVFYMNGFHQLDVRRLQGEFLFIYNIYRNVCGGEPLSEEIESTANILKQALPKQMFVVEGDSFQEVEEGKTQKLLKDYEEKNFFRMFEAQVKAALNE